MRCDISSVRVSSREGWVLMGSPENKKPASTNTEAGWENLPFAWHRPKGGVRVTASQYAMLQRTNRFSSIS
jgi:hypothetical protein